MFKRVLILTTVLLLCLSSAFASENEALDFGRFQLDMGQKSAVYTGPGTNYLRAASGKALVSTNGKVALAGGENGWALIRYQVNGGGLRIGYVDASGLRGAGTIPDLELYYDPGVIVSDCAMTDQPDQGQATIAFLKAGMEITLLCPYYTKTADWAYIEAQVGKQLVRGFVPVVYVSSSLWDASQPGGQG